MLWKSRASLIYLLYVVSQTRREQVFFLILLYFALNMVCLVFQLQILENLTLHIVVFLSNLESDFSMVKLFAGLAATDDYNKS